MSVVEIAKLVIDSLPFLAEGAEITIFLSVVSLIFGVLLGVLVAITRYLHTPIAEQVGRVYVSIFRGTPLLVQLFVIYYGFPQLGITLDPISSGIIGLSLNIGAYLSESFRAALESVPAGQHEAGFAVGLTRYQVVWYLVLPQSLRTALPTIGNNLINLVKDTSLVSVITVTELLKASTLVIARTFQPLPLYLEAAVIYWVINFAFGMLQKRLETTSSRFVVKRT